MTTYIRKYKTLILAGLIGAYLLGSLHYLFLEGFHFIAHIADELGTSLQHSYYDHMHEDGKVHTHRHVVLDNIDDSAADTEGYPVSSEDKLKLLKKKNPEYRLSNRSSVHFQISNPALPAYACCLRTAVFISIPTPPPRPLTEA